MHKISPTIQILANETYIQRKSLSHKDPLILRFLEQSNGGWKSICMEDYDRIILHSLQLAPNFVNNRGIQLLNFITEIK